MKTSSLTTVVAGLTPAGSFSAAPNFFHSLFQLEMLIKRLKKKYYNLFLFTFLSATDLGTLTFSTRNIFVIFKSNNYNLRFLIK
jgi:hypothetical protein